MRKQPNLFLFASLIPVTLLLGTGTTVAAQESHAHADAALEPPPAALKKVRWSDPSAWPEGRSGRIPPGPGR